MRANDLCCVEDFFTHYRPTQANLEETLTLLLEHTEGLLVLAAAFLQDGGHVEEHRAGENDLLETARLKTVLAVESLLLAESLLECTALASGGSHQKIHTILTNVKRKVEKLGDVTVSDPEKLLFVVCPTKRFGVEDFEEYPVIYYASKSGEEH